VESPAVGEGVTYSLHEVTSDTAVAGITLERVSNLARFFQDSHTD